MAARGRYRCRYAARAVPRSILLLRDGFPAEPGLDVAVSRALLVRVGAGEVPESFRLHRPGREVAFGRHDVISPGYGAAVAAALRRGFAAVERLAGGRAAVFHEGTLAFSWTVPHHDPMTGIHERFRAVAGLVAAALQRLGVEARVGEVPGEYCPGTYSVNVAGTWKVAGIGQRLSRGAAHLGGVVVVEGAGEVVQVLRPVYAALGLAWRPETTGAVADHAAVTVADVAEALVDELNGATRVVHGVIDPATAALARELHAHHVVACPAAPAGGD